MALMILMQSAAPGVLMVNGQFCGPLEADGQAFPAARNAEIYVQLFPFEPAYPPLTAAMTLRGGMVAQLAPAAHAFALHWPDDVIQLELRPCGLPPEAALCSPAGETAAPGLLLRWLNMRLAGDAQAGSLTLPGAAVPELAGYMAAVPLMYVPAAAREGWAERVGLVRRTAENAAVVDMALAQTAPAGQGRRLLSRIDLRLTGE